SEASAKPGCTGLEACAGSLDDDGRGNTGGTQYGVLLDRGAGADADAFFVKAAEPLQLNVELVDTWRQRAEAQLPLVIRRLGRASAHQRRRGHVYRRARQHAALRIAGGSD